MHRTLALGALAVTVATVLLALAPPTQAEAGLAATGDADLGARLSATTARLSFLDADGDDVPDAALPDEPAYLDLDASGDVSFGDVRLTSYGPYAAGTLVDVANRDAGRPLTQAAGWLGTLRGQWFADLDGDRAVSTGDVRLGADGDAKVRGGDADLGHGLALPARAVGSRDHLDHVDGDRDGRRDVGTPLYLDADGDRTVSPGDLRLTPAAFGVDVGPSPAEVEAALQVLAAAEAARAAAEAQDAEAGWKAWQVVTLLAAFVALAAVAFVVVRSRRAPGPRDPFTTAPLAPGRFK